MWHYARGQQTFGPLSWEELWRLAQQGGVQPSDFVLPAGSREWQPAWQIRGLLPQTAVQALPEPDSFSVRPGSDQATGYAPGGYAPQPYAPSGPTFWSVVWGHIRRAFQWNLQKVEATPEERAYLSSQQVEDPTLQRYLVWRHSMLLVLVAPICLLALLSAIDFLTTGLEHLSGVGYLWAFLHVLLPFSMPAAAITSMFLWYRPRFTYRLMRVAWLVSFLGPIVLFLIPASLLFRLEELVQPGGDVEAAGMGARFLFGIGIFVALWIYLPITLTSIALGVQRAGVRLKTLLPESMVPGLFLAASSPIMPLLFLPLFVLVSQLAGNVLLLLGMAALVASPLMYAFFAKTFIQPLLSDADFIRLHRVQLAVRILFWCGLGLFLIYALTAKIPIPNLNAQPGEPRVYEKTLLGFTAEGSFARPWSWRLLRWVLVELMGRALFTMVLVSDLFMRISGRMWTYQKQLATSERVKDYEALMERVHEGMQK